VVCPPSRLAVLSVLLASSYACARVAQPAVLPLNVQATGAVELYGPGLVATDDSGETITFATVAPANVVIVRVWPGARLQAIYPLRNKDTVTFARGMHTVQVERPRPWMAWPTYTSDPFTAVDTTGEEAMMSRCFWNELRAKVPPLPSPADSAAAQTTLARRLRKADLAAIEDSCGAGAHDRWRLLPGDTVPPPVGAYFVVLVASDAPQDARRLRMKLAGMDITASDVISVLQALPAILAGSAAHSWAAYEAFVP
jgi:hypothetical protein